MRSPGEFRAVLRSGRKRVCGDLAIHVLARESGSPRLGLVVPRAVGTAVVRNRFKRRVRALWREFDGRGSIDCVVVARCGAGKASFDELRSALYRCLERSVGTQ